MGYMVMKYTRIQIGDSINDIPSPTLLIDMDALENNYEVVAREYRASNCKMRQHAKNIKSPQVLKMQMEAGGTVGGVCTAKVSEAEVMFESGINDILITSEIVDVSKMERMVKLSLNCDLKVVVDNVHSLKELGTIASNFGATVGVLIEVDTSMNRAGVRSVEEGVQLAKLAETLSGITFKGVMSHQSINGWPDRSTRFEEGKEFIGMCLDVKKGIEDAGIKVEIVSSGETYTYDLASSIGLGLSLAIDKNVISIDGDGSILMNMNTLATIGNRAPSNYTLLIVDNGSYGSTGDQKTFTNEHTSLKDVAIGEGCKNVIECSGE